MNPKDDFNPTWSPDGARIAFSSDRKGVRDIYLKQANGTGEEELLAASAIQKHVEDWSPDGKAVLYNTAVSGLWAVPVGGDRKPFPVVQGPASTYDQGRFSPDGKWIVYRSTESGREQIYLQGFPVAGAKFQISTDGGREPSWRRDGKELYYTFANKLMAVGCQSYLWPVRLRRPKDTLRSALHPRCPAQPLRPSPGWAEVSDRDSSGRGLGEPHPHCVELEVSSH